jgi:chorismate dehydratase
MTRLTRIGAVSYLNTTPLVRGLDVSTDIEVTSAVPSRIVDLLVERKADIALVSLIDAANAGIPLTLIPVGMIGCDGPTLTVRLFSRVPLDQITRVHADTDSHTSRALGAVILHDKFGVRPEVVDFNAREQMASSGSSGDEGSPWPETVLLIGDKVVADSPPAVRYPHQLDLGEAWKAITGLPFVYATWMCRSDEVSSEHVLRAARLLHRQRLRNAVRLDHIVSDEAHQHGWSDDLARDYVGSLLRYEVTAEAREAVGLFFDKAAGLGLCPRLEPEWMDLDAVSSA